MKSKLNRFSIMYLSMILDEVACDETWPLTVCVDVCMSEEEGEKSKREGCTYMNIHICDLIDDNRISLSLSFPFSSRSLSLSLSR